MTRFSLSTVLALLFALVSCPAFAQATQVQNIGVQLFYEVSGTLSEDVTKTKDFHYLNTLIGEGDAKEPANSFHVTIFLSGKPESFDAKDSVTVTISDENPKKFKPVVRRISGLLFGQSGKLVKAIFVENRVCSPLTIKARAKQSEKSVKIPFACGE